MHSESDRSFDEVVDDFKVGVTGVVGVEMTVVDGELEGGIEVFEGEVVYVSVDGVLEAGFL